MDARGIGDVALHGPRLATSTTNFSGYLLDAVGGPGRDDNRGSLGGEGVRDCRADPLATARHDCDRAVKSLH